MAFRVRRQKWKNLQSLIGDKGFHFKGRNGQTVLLIHGLTGAPSEMIFVARNLNRKGFTVICPLLAGHGGDEKLVVKTGWRDWYCSAERVLLALAKDGEKIHVGGICVGGTLGLVLAMRHAGKVASVVLYSATLVYNGWSMPKSRVIMPLVRWWGKLPVLRDFGWPERHPFGIKDDRIRNKLVNESAMKDCLPSFPFPSLAEMYRLVDYVRARLHEVTTPVLLIHAREDDISDVTNAYYIREQLGGKSELQILEDSYHMIHVDREHGKVANLSADFFERQAEAPVGEAAFA